MKQVIKVLLRCFLRDNQIHYLKGRVMRVAVSSKKDIITKYSLKSYGNQNSDCFFGYYDISPFQPSGSNIIYLSKRKGEADAEIILRDVETDNVKVVGRTRAWNWQQGSRLRWSPRSEDQIIYNDYTDGKYVTRLVNVVTSETDVLDWPLYDVNLNGRLGITVDFSRLGFMRPGYGYTNKVYRQSGSLREEGISLIDLEQKTSRKIVSYAQIAEKLGEATVDFERHYINHLSFSPTGNKFLFFWIKIRDDGVHQASLFVFDLKGKVLIELEHGLSVSHYRWIDDESILITAYDAKRECRYYIYSVNGKKEMVLADLVTRDGHPTVLENGDIVTDTYVDRYGFQKILYIDVKSNIVTELIDIFSTYKCFGEERCDLHPRLNRQNDQICFDANVNGYRKVYILKGWQ